MKTSWQHKKSATDSFKSSAKRVIQKMLVATGDLCENKIPERIAKAASKSTCDNAGKSIMLAQTVETSMQLIAIPKEKYISPGKQQQIINKYRLL